MLNSDADDAYSERQRVDNSFVAREVARLDSLVDSQLPGLVGAARVNVGVDV